MLSEAERGTAFVNWCCFFHYKGFRVYWNKNHKENAMTTTPPDALPFVAPCKKLDTFAALRWLASGWQDLKTVPWHSLSFGVILFIISIGISYIGFAYDGIYGLLTLLSGFVLLGPIIAIALYSISSQLEQGLKPRFGYCFHQGRRHIGNELIFMAVLLIVFLIWARAASMVHIFFPSNADAAWQELALFLGIGSLIGAIFATAIFVISAFSLPMIIDRKADMITAVITSVNAVLRNKRAMLVWAGVIVLGVAFSFATGLLGLIVIVPLLGHATWHGYRETINAEAWPKHEDS
jgi:uncharacterized membrane protein